MDELIRLHLNISGSVQGVFYRVSAKDEADKLMLKGWVKNNDEGQVEIEVQGGEKNVQEFIDWCKKGPDGAEVQDVEITKLEGFEDFRNFSIK